MSDEKSRDGDDHWVLEPKPAAYGEPLVDRERIPPAGPRRRTLRVARADRRRAEAHADPQTPYITGRYQSDAAAGAIDTHDACLLHVNQAGLQIKGMIVDISGKNVRIH